MIRNNDNNPENVTIMRAPIAPHNDDSSSSGGMVKFVAKYNTHKPNHTLLNVSRLISVFILKIKTMILQDYNN